MRAQVRHLDAGIIPEPAEMVQRAVRVVGTPRRGTKPEIVIEIRRGSSIGWRAEAGHDVPKGSHASAVNLADVPGAQDIARLLEVLTAPLLGADLHDAFVALSRDCDPAAFPNEQGERLLDVNVLARGAREDRHQRMPVIGSANDN